jgi:predicted RNase H-like HicB family nuclease
MEKFSAVFEQVNDWWIGYVEELPGANTQGRSLDEARENLKETVQLIIETNRELTRRELEGKIFIREQLLVPALTLSDYQLMMKSAKHSKKEIAQNQ